MTIQIAEFVRYKLKTGFGIWHTPEGKSLDYQSKFSHDLEVGKEYYLPRFGRVKLERICLTPSINYKRSWFKKLMAPAIEVDCVFLYKSFGENYDSVTGLPFDEFISQIEQSAHWDRQFNERVKELNKGDHGW